MVPEKEFENVPMHKKATIVKPRVETITLYFPTEFLFFKGQKCWLAPKVYSKKYYLNY